MHGLSKFWLDSSKPFLILERVVPVAAMKFLLLLLVAVLLLHWEPCSNFSMLGPGRSLRGPPPQSDQTPKRSYAAEVSALSVTSRLGTWSMALRSFARRVLALLSMFAWWNSTTSKAQRAVTGAAPAAGIAGAWKVNPVVEVAQTDTNPVPSQNNTTLTTVAVNSNDAVNSQEDTTQPHVPGMSATNLVVRLDSEPGIAATKVAEEKMKQSDQEVLEDLCGEGWGVRPIDASQGLFEMTLPAVRYQMPMGVVSIPSPLFHAQVRNSSKVSGNYHERLVADIVLQNGDKMLCVELGFPFSSKFTISAAGWARCNVDSRVQRERAMPSLCGDGAPSAQGSRPDFHFAILCEVLCQQIRQRLRRQPVKDWI